MGVKVWRKEDEEEEEVEGERERERGVRWSEGGGGGSGGSSSSSGFSGAKGGVEVGVMVGYLLTTTTGFDTLEKSDLKEWRLYLRNLITWTIPFTWTPFTGTALPFFLHKAVLRGSASKDFIRNSQLSLPIVKFLNTPDASLSRSLSVSLCYSVSQFLILNIVSKLLRTTTTILPYTTQNNNN